jgi:hypothetical protein
VFRYGDGSNNTNRIITSAAEINSTFRDYVQRTDAPYKPIGMTQRKTAAANFSRSIPTMNDPRVSYLSLMVPDDQLVLNSMYRYYDSTDPIIQNAHRLHTEFPLSNMSLIDCGEPAIQRHFEEMWNDRIQGDTFLLQVGIEYNRMGNVITFGAWNETDYMWDKIAILNPDYVIIEDTWVAQRPLIKLRPDENLKKIVSTQRPRALYQQLHPEIIRYVRMGMDIPLHPANTWHLTYNRAPYEIWGQPPIKALLKLLFYENKLMEAQTAIAYRHIVPITLVKVGHEQTGWLPEPSELQDVEEILAAREMDPNLAIIYHYGINIEYVGASGKILPVQQDLQRIDELKMMGLGISKAFLGGEGGPTYSNASVALAVLKQRYLHITRKFSRFISSGIFQPVSDACGFYRADRAQMGYGGGTKRTFGEMSTEREKLAKSFTNLRDYQDNKEFQEFIKAKASEKFRKEASEKREYIYPKPDWNLMSLSGDLDWRRWVSEYNDKFQSAAGVPFISDSTMYKLMGLDEKSERITIMHELLENKERKAILERNEIIPSAASPAGGGSELGGGGGGFGGMGGGDIPIEGLMPTGEEQPMGVPGQEGEALGTGGELGEMPTMENIPAQASDTQVKKIASEDDEVLDDIEKELIDSMSKELEESEV